MLYSGYTLKLIVFYKVLPLFSYVHIIAFSIHEGFICPFSYLE